MSETRIIRPSAYAIEMMTQRERIPLATGEYDTVKSTTSRMDDKYTHVLEYISYLLSMLVLSP